MKALRITKCSDPFMWYAAMIGQIVPLCGVWPESGYYSREPAGYANVVRFDDAEVVELEAA